MGVFRAIMLVFFLTGTSLQQSAKEYSWHSLLQVSNTQYLYKQGQSKIRIIFSYIISSFLYIYTKKTKGSQLPQKKSKCLPSPRCEKPKLTKWKKLLEENWGLDLQCQQISWPRAMWGKPFWTFLSSQSSKRTHEASVSPNAQNC